MSADRAAGGRPAVNRPLQRIRAATRPVAGLTDRGLAGRTAPERDSRPPGTAPSPEQMQRLRRLALARPSSATEALPYATVRGYAGPGSALIGVVIVLGVVMILGYRLRAHLSKRGR